MREKNVILDYREPKPHRLRRIVWCVVNATLFRVLARPQLRRVRNALLRTGVPQVQLREVLLHIGHYCGIPTGAACFAIVRKVMKDEGIEPEELLQDVESVYRTDRAVASSF